MQDLQRIVTDFMALPQASKAIIFGVVGFIALRCWLGYVGAWPSRGGNGDGSSAGFGGDGEGGCD